MTRADFEDVLERLRQVYPREGCGFLTGRAGVVERHFPIRNVAAQAHRFRMAPQEQVAALLAAAQAGHEVVAIYHSHPHGPARPSTRDEAEVTFPDAFQLIVSLRQWDRPMARAFAWRGNRFVSVPLHIV